jgi:hypothetical protein
LAFRNPKPWSTTTTTYSSSDSDLSTKPLDRADDEARWERLEHCSTTKPHANGRAAGCSATCVAESPTRPPERSSHRRHHHGERRDAQPRSSRTSCRRGRGPTARPSAAAAYGYATGVYTLAAVPWLRVRVSGRGSAQERDACAGASPSGGVRRSPREGRPQTRLSSGSAANLVGGGDPGRPLGARALTGRADRFGADPDPASSFCWRHASEPSRFCRRNGEIRFLV